MEITVIPTHHRRSGFSLLELIFVIVILGIVASLGSELIARIYQQYIVQRAQHRASFKTEMAALQIANRLSSAIPGTVIRRIGIAGTPENINNPMIEDPTGNTYDVLQWVGSDTESFNTYDGTKVGWSGFCDLDSISTTATTGGADILTPGSNLSLARTIINNLSATNMSEANVSIFFPNLLSPIPIEYGVSSLSESTITLDAPPSGIIREHYKLAWTSYALVITDGNLYLHYNFAPSRATTITTAPNKISLLMKNISTFKFKGDGGTIRFKICKEEQISENADDNITSCKEKAVF